MGRVALYNNVDLFYNGVKAACIGNYECIDDGEAHMRLVDAVAQDAAQLGFPYLIGPMNGSTWDDYRFSVDHKYPLFFTEPEHHWYYNRQFQQFGFEVMAKYVSGISDCSNYLKLNTSKFDSLYQNGVDVRQIDIDDFENELKRLYEFCIIAFQNNFLYTPISFTYFRQKYLVAKNIIDPEFFRIARDVNGSIVGFMFCIDDLYNRRERNLIIKTIARHPDEKWKGMTNLLGDTIYSLAREKGYKHVLHAFMHEKNASVTVSKNFSGSVIRNYALYGIRL